MNGNVQLVIRFCLVLVIVFLCIEGLNVAAQGISAMTLEKEGPILAWSIGQKGEVVFTCLGENRSLETGEIRGVYRRLERVLSH
ncbi:MAG TPA: hypothetical protein PLE01_01130 [Syntrophothermus lipocalidus]|nr:hypothetical protein [Syntrophothermus lipocalidus]